MGKHKKIYRIIGDFELQLHQMEVVPIMSKTLRSGKLHLCTECTIYKHGSSLRSRDVDWTMLEEHLQTLGYACSGLSSMVHIKTAYVGEE